MGVAVRACGRDAMSEERIIKIPMPLSVEVNVFPSAEPGREILLLSAKCIDVADGQIGDFLSRPRTVTAGSRRELLDFIVDWLRHEVAEQLGMKPHENDT
jgi:hypothetical protein